MSDDAPTGGRRCRRASAGPTGIRAAACFTFDVDAESPILFEHPEAADWLDVMSHQAYGAADRDRPAPPDPRPARRPGDVLHPGLHAPSAGRRSAARSATPATRSPTTATSTRAPTAPTPAERGAPAPARPRGARRGPRRPPDRLPRPELGADVRHAGAPRPARLPLRLRADGRRPPVRARDVGRSPARRRSSSCPATGRSTTGSRTTTCPGSPARA